MGILGADVSHYQDFTPTAGLSFLWAKATEGTRFADPAYSTHVGRAISHSLLPGAYHFARNDEDLDAQARWFIAHATGARALAIDNEGPHALTRAQVRTLINLVRKYDSLHRHVGLYMSDLAPFFLNVGADFNWVAHYGVAVPITTPWHIHQYTSSPFDKDRAISQKVLDSIFQVTPPPATGHQVHIGHNARVRVYKLGTKVISGQRCIASWPPDDALWPGPSSHASCTAPVKRRTCDNSSWAWTVTVTSGAYRGRTIRVNARGVTAV